MGTRDRVVSIYCLVKLKSGANPVDFVEQASQLPNVREAKLVLGECDAMVVFECAEFFAAADVAVKQLRQIESVESTRDVVCP